MTSGPAGTEQRLREALDAVANNVHAAPDAYQQVRREWHRRERRRRLILAILIAVVFAIADAIGLWALNQTRVDAPVIFNGPGSVQPHKNPADGISQP
ncbi:hypothetical protein GCM10027290_02890 [Micromonospora sonneratiae]|jgi:hypothetical protein|uniref:Uncharacterized protein n=1 Tax=Micromonospora sonneratiae TaxID=1184706 RepID=A0ABW3Y5C5_9ACTN